MDTYQIIPLLILGMEALEIRGIFKKISSANRYFILSQGDLTILPKKYFFKL